MQARDGCLVIDLDDWQKQQRRIGPNLFGDFVKAPIGVPDRLFALVIGDEISAKAFAARIVDRAASRIDSPSARGGILTTLQGDRFVRVHWHSPAPLDMPAGSTQSASKASKT